MLFLYTTTISLIGTFLLITGFSELSQSITSSIVIIAFLGIILESMEVHINKENSVTIGFAIGLVCIISFKPSVASLVLFTSSMLSVYKVDGKIFHIFNSSFTKRIFNSSVYAIGGFLSSLAYFDIAKDSVSDFYGFNILGIIISTIIYIIINISVYSVLFSILHKESPLKLFREYLWVVFNFLGIAPIGIIMAISYKQYGLFALILFFGPLLLARYSFKLYLDMKAAYFDTINSLTQALEAKDKYTRGHSSRVAIYSELIGQELKLNQVYMENLKNAALLHDIGKIGISDSIIKKPGKLDFYESYEIKRHPEIGASIINNISFLKQSKLFVEQHHERYDGCGYPNGLSKDQIPLEAYILSLADTFDAMTSDRPYRLALTEEQALKIIISEKEKQFEPKTVEAFERLHYKFGSVKEHAYGIFIDRYGSWAEMGETPEFEASEA
jgi:putative nucleotidyltransferase with HDIG domain